MKSSPSEKTPTAVAPRWLARGLAIYALAAGLVTFLGWFAGFQRLTDWGGSGISMFANTALVTLLAATAIVLFSQRSSQWILRLTAFLGIAVAAIAAATLLEHLAGVNLGIDTILVNPTWGNKAATMSGRMGPPASTAFTLTGIALFLLSRRWKIRRVVPVLGIIVCAAAMLSIAGYMFGADRLFSVARYTGIAMQTATILWALGLAIIVSVPEYDPARTLWQPSAAGLLARRSLPFVVVLPIALGWVRVWAQRAGWIDTGMGIALLVLALIATLCCLLWWCIRAVSTHEQARHRSEQALRESELLLSVVLKQLPVGLGVTDTTGHWLVSNPLMDHFVPKGIPSTQPDHVGRWRAYDFHGKPIPPENWPGKRALRGEIVSPGLEMVFTDDDGKDRWMRVSSAPLRNEAGTIIGATAVVQDIDRIKRIEEQLAVAKQRLEAHMDNSPLAVIEFDSQFRVIRWSREAERLFGWTAAEITGRAIGELRWVHEDDVEAVSRVSADMLHGQRPRNVTINRNHRKDGSIVHCEWYNSAIYDESCRLTSVLSLVLDITERKKTEERLGRLAAIVDHSEDAIVGKNLDGIVTSWNPGAEAMFAWPASEMLGRSIRQIIPPEHQAEEDFILLNLRLGKAVHRETVRLQKTGRRVAVSITCSPVKDPAGNVIGGAEIARDITEQKETEEKLREAQRKLLIHAADLEATVAERTAKLQESVNELQSFSYSIAHDMRAPLRAMGTFAQLLLNEVSANRGLSADAKDFSNRIIVGASRLDNLINDALNYTKAMLQEFPLQTVDLAKLLRGLLDTYPNLHSDNADIQIEGQLPVVLGNESLLTQCFSNLLGNAVKFVAPGVRPHVRVWSQQKDGVVCVWVEDNGIGIPKHAQPRLFAMFQKLDNQYEGTGIGLAIVRKVVERIGGKTGVESEPGQGSRFWVELRLAKRENA